MRILSNTLTCAILITSMLLEFSGPAIAGDIFREGVFLSSLERSDAQSLPPVVTQGQRPYSAVPNPETRLTSGNPSLPVSTEGATFVASAEQLTEVTAERVTPVHAEFQGEAPELFASPTETIIDHQAEAVACPSVPCQSEGSWLCQTCDTFRRKICLKQNFKHNKTLYPVIRPHCQPAYGIYETCWRQLQPNRCCYQYQESLVDPSLLPAPQPAPANGQEPLKTPPSELPRPYEK